MLKIAEVGFNESVKSHNCDIATVCDWIEISLLFCDTEISQVQIADILHEQGIYPKIDEELHGQHFGEFINSIWNELERRGKLMGKLNFAKISGSRLTRTLTRDNCIPLAYMMLLSSANYYESVRRVNAGKYVDQGELFEDFCCLALDNSGWKSARTGWSSRTGAKKLEDTVAVVAEVLSEPHVNAKEIALDREENEAGCDLVCHRPFKDEWQGRPVVLIQCASGVGFKKKLGTPSIDRWRNYIGFSTIPLRGFCTPFAFHKEEFRRHCGKVSGLLLDRYRLLEPFAAGVTTLPAALEKRVKAWILPRLRALPTLK